MIIRFLAWVGLVRVVSTIVLKNGLPAPGPPKVRWPFDVWPWDWWVIFFRNGPVTKNVLGGWFSVFRNSPGVVKWQKGRLLPRRWGIRVFGLEIGDRG